MAFSATADSQICTQAIEELTIGGCLIQKGTLIVLNTYATHRHPALWERPNDFYPEHFFDLQGVKNRHKYAFFPFGGGLHNCIGRHFAELEMMIIIVSLLREFTFKTNGTVKEAASITLKPERDIVLSIKPLNKNTD